MIVARGRGLHRPDPARPRLRRRERADHYLDGPDRSDPFRRFMDLVTEVATG